MKTKEIKTNAIIINEAINKVKKEFKSGINVSELDMSEIETVLERVNAIHKPKERERALRTFDRALDRFAEYIAKHSTDEGFYTEKTDKNDVESEAQLKAGLYDKRRPVNQTVFSAFLCNGEDGSEFYTFELGEDAGHRIENYTELQIMLDEAFSLLKEDVKLVGRLYENGYTIEESARISGLTPKQVRGRRDKYLNMRKDILQKVL